MFYYHATHVRNLGSIKPSGLVPLALRAAGPVAGATAQNRKAKETEKITSQIRQFLFQCLKEFYSMDKIVATPGASIVLTEPTITGEIIYGETPERVDIVNLDKTTKTYMAAYFELLTPADITEPSKKSKHLTELNLSGIVAFRNKQASLVSDFEAHHPEHFIVQLARRYAKGWYDVEDRITRERVYMFNQEYFTSGYTIYAKEIAGGVIADIAILRMDHTHCGELKDDSGQGNAKTTTSIIAPQHIEYVIGVPDAQLKDGSIYIGATWQALSAYTLPIAEAI